MKGSKAQPDAMGALALPLFDLADFHQPGERRDAFVARLRRVLHEESFFYLTGHGVRQRQLTEVMDLAKRFFALPTSDKLDIAMTRSPHFRGYNRAGQERTRGAPDWREQLDINTDSAPFPMEPDSPAWRRLQGPNQWPAALPELKPALLAYQAEVTRVGIEVLRAIAIALGQEPDAFAQIYQPQPSQLLKIIRYPGRDDQGSVQGVGAHRDGGFVTVLLQDQVAGLRVRARDGSWICAPPVPESFVINTGELLELATNGYVHATVHDVVTPPPGCERFSIAFFLGCRPDAVVPVIDLPEELRQGVRGLSADPLNPIFREVGRNQLKSRLRSHPDVGLLHYPELSG